VPDANNTKTSKTVCSNFQKDISAREQVSESFTWPIKTVAHNLGAMGIKKCFSKKRKK
jgi:hypothetical protein